MKSDENYSEINRQSWNSKVEFHLKSAFYDMKGFLLGNSSLNSIELDLLGDVQGKTVLHLQCHFGQDSISLSRLGAEVTGVDLSDKAIEAARKIAEDTNSSTKFICCDIYDLPNHLDQNSMLFSRPMEPLVGCQTWINGRKLFRNPLNPTANLYL